MSQQFRFLWLCFRISAHGLIAWTSGSKLRSLWLVYSLRRESSWRGVIFVDEWQQRGEAAARICWLQGLLG